MKTRSFSTGRFLCLLACAVLPMASCSNDDHPASTDSADGEVQWIDPNELEPGPIRHESLTEEQLARIETLKKTFAEVSDQSLEQWVDNFKRDANPDSELVVWERMAKAYNRYCSNRELQFAAKEEVFKIVLLRSMAPKEEVLERLELKIIPRDDAMEIMDSY